MSKGKLAEAMKATKHCCKKSLLLFDGGTNGGISGCDMGPMEESHPSD